jgi:hypothetical protein
MSSRSLASLSRFASWLDAGIHVPGTRLRFGLDPIIGLIPGAGDAAGAGLAGWIFVEAVRMGASRATLTRIAGNVMLDACIGAVPLLGDIFDFAWKANRRNITLLERHLATPVRAERADRAFVALVAAGVVAVGAGLLALGGLLTAWLLKGLGLG